MTYKSDEITGQEVLKFRPSALRHSYTLSQELIYSFNEALIINWQARCP